MQNSSNTKYGFVYLWRDRLKNRYYIGSHWGDENDGYICSSDWMLNAYNKRPADFKRRIVFRIKTNRTELLKEELRWLMMMKLGEYRQGEKSRYYNLTRTNSLLHDDETRIDALRNAFSERTIKNKPQNLDEMIADLRNGMKQPEVCEKYAIKVYTLRKYLAEAGIPKIKDIKPISKSAIFRNRVKLTKEEQAALTSKRLKERWASEEGRNKLIESYKDRPDRTGKMGKQAAAMKQLWADPEWRERQITKYKEAATSL